MEIAERWLQRDRKCAKVEQVIALAAEKSGKCDVMSWAPDFQSLCSSPQLGDLECSSNDTICCGAWVSCWHTAPFAEQLEGWSAAEGARDQKSSLIMVPDVMDTAFLIERLEAISYPAAVRARSLSMLISARGAVWLIMGVVATQPIRSPVHDTGFARIVLHTCLVDPAVGLHLILGRVSGGRLRDDFAAHACFSPSLQQPAARTRCVGPSP